VRCIISLLCVMALAGGARADSITTKTKIRSHGHHSSAPLQAVNVQAVQAPAPPVYETVAPLEALPAAPAWAPAPRIEYSTPAFSRSTYSTREYLMPAFESFQAPDMLVTGSKHQAIHAVKRQARCDVHAIRHSSQALAVHVQSAVRYVELLPVETYSVPVVRQQFYRQPVYRTRPYRDSWPCPNCP
jgi:hypothetical protein